MFNLLQEIINEGIAYMQAGRYELAEQTFRKALEEDKKSVEAYLHLGNAFANQGKFEEAVKAFKMALMLKPESGLLYYNIGCVHFLNDDWLNAVLNFNKAEEFSYKSEELYLMKAAVYQQSEDYVQAVREINKAILLKPFKPGLYVKKAHLQADLGHIENAVETSEQLCELMPDALEGYELGVWLACLEGKYDKAQHIADKGKEKFPLDPAFALLKIDIYRAQKDYEKLILITEEALKYELDTETKVQVVLFKAEALGQLGRLQEMKKSLEMYQNEDRNGKLLYMLLLIYVGEKDYAKVKAISVKIQGMDVSEHFVAAAKFSFAEAVLYTEGMGKARELYMELTRELRAMTIKNPGLYEVYIYRLLCHTTLEEYDKALELADFLEKAYPELADGHLYKYHIYTKMGRMAEAQEEKAKALEVNPDVKVQWQ